MLNKFLFVAFFILTATSIQLSNQSMISENDKCVEKRTKQKISKENSHFENVKSQFRIFDEPIQIDCSQNSTKSKMLTVKYIVSNILGFDVKSEFKLAELISAKYIELNVYLKFSNFAFYTKNSRNRNKSTAAADPVDMSSSESLIAAYHDLNNNDDLRSTQLTQTPQLNNVSLMYETFETFFPINGTIDFYIQTSVHFRSPLSRVLFKNARIFRYVLFRLTNTTLRRHLIEMAQNDSLIDFVLANELEEDRDEKMSQTLNSNESVRERKRRIRIRLDSSVSNYLLYDLYNIYIGESIVDPVILANVARIRLEGFLTGIFEYTFKSFEYLRKLSIETFSLRKFFHSSSDHKWLIHLNVKNNLSHFTLY